MRRFRRAGPQGPVLRLAHRDRIGLLRCIALSSALMLSAGSVRAHGEGASINVTPNPATAGDTIQVFGDNFAAGDGISVEIRTAGGDELLFEGQADDAGHLTASVSLPADLSDRVYEVRSTADDGSEASMFLTVQANVASVGADPASPAQLLVIGAGLLLIALLSGLIVRGRRSRRGLRSAE